MATAATVTAKFEADISDVQAKMGALRSAFKDAGDSSKNMSDRMVALGGAMSNVGRKMTIGVSLPLAGIGAAAVHASMQFETSMNKIVGLVGIASDEVKQMEQDVLGMAGQVGKAPEELANGLFVITSAGLRGSEAMSALEQSAKAGAAGLGETNDIARAVSGALSAYGSDVLSAADATDAIVATARAGNFETSQFAAAIGRVLPFAQQAGASFQEMGGAVALLTRVNGDAAQSVTQTAALFRAFVVPTEEAKKALQNVGMSAQDLRTAISEKGLPAALQMLDDKLGGNREQLGRILGSSEAASAAFQILNADSQTLADTFGVVADSSGMTQEAFDAVSETAQFQLNQAMAELKAQMIDLGNIIIPVATQFIDFAKTVLEAFGRLPQPVKTFIVGIGAILTALGPLLWIGGKIIAMFGTLSTAFLLAKAKIVVAAGTIGNVFGAMSLQMKAAMIGAQTQFGALVAGIRAGAATAGAAVRGMATAMKGALISTGIGALLVGIGIAFESFMSAQADAEEAVDSLTEAMKEQNDVMAEGVALQLAQDMQEVAYGFAESTKFIDDLALLGVTLDDAILAVMKGGPALKEFGSGLMASAEGNRELEIAAAGVIGTLAQENEKVTAAKAKFEAYTASKEIAARVMGQVEDSERSYTSATVEAAIAAGNAVGPTEDLADALNTITDAAGNVITELDVMRQEYSDWLVVTGQISAVDQASASLEQIGTAAVELGTDLMGRSPEARDFRDAVIGAFEDSAAAAASLSDDLPTQRAIFTGELVKIVAALRANGVKRKDIEAFLGAMDDLPTSVSDIMKAAAQAVGDTDFKSGIEKAFDKSVKAGAPMTADAMERLADGASKAAKEQLGLTLEPELAGIIKSSTASMRPTAFNNGRLTGKSIGSGAAYGINQSSPIVIAAVERVMAAAKAAADAAVESDSPSKLFARTGDDMMAGVAMGVQRSSRKVTDTVSKAARLFIRAFREAFMPRDMGEAETAIANAIAEAEDRLTEARDRLKEANKEVKDAEKALADIREQDGASQKEIAKAEKELAAARRKASEAADDVKLGEWVKANEKALQGLQKIARQYDYIIAKMEGVNAAFDTLTGLLERPLGTESDLSRMFEFGQDPSNLARNYMGLAETIREAYAALIDPKIVGRKAARGNRKAMNAAIAELEGYVAQMIALQEEYDANLEQLRKNEEQWRIDEKALSDKLNAATKAYDEATRDLEKIVNERNGFIAKIEGGFRSFVNNLSGLTADLTSAVKTETQSLANGVRLIIQSTEQGTLSGAAAIGQRLQDRLSEVRTFSKNIQSLMERGLDPSLIRDFIESGVSGAGETVALLASATDDELKGINDTQAELLKYAQEFSTGVGEAYYGASIRAQEQIVKDLKAEVDAAQKALDDARKAFEAEQDRLEAENARLESEITALGTRIEAMITNLMATLPAQTQEAAQDSIDSMIAEWQRKYPELESEMGKIMDDLAKSMERTVTIHIRTVEDGGSSSSSRSAAARATGAAFAPGPVAIASTSAGRSVTVAPNAVAVNVTAGAGTDQAALVAQVRAAVDESLNELAREIVAA